MTHTAVDVGGTFTDVVVWDGTALVTGKVPTTPDQSLGVIEGVKRFATGETRLVHGTTAATNAVLQRSGARTALITDAGFEDLIEIGRQDRPSLYDSTVSRPEPIAPPTMRFGLAGRAYADLGDVPDREALNALIERVTVSDAEAIAVSLLFSFSHRQREAAVARALAEALPGVPVSLSSDVVAEFREFERTSTTLLNAYLVPVVSSYLERLAGAAQAAGVEGSPSVMRSSGGLISLSAAAALPAAILLSGPAGGAVAASALGRALGRSTVVSFDMGGTSTDVCRIDGGRPEVGYERSIAGLPCRMPSVAVHTVGAGGGSLAWVDEGGALRVGPQSAGANPGPAAYGRGGTGATVTDADLILGRIGSEALLAGTLALDRSAAAAALERIGGSVGMDARAVANGIVTVVESHMERAIRRVSVEEGADPRRSVLVAFGGAGGLHATALARRLDMAGVLIPAHAGVFSAFGMLLAPPRADVARSVLLEPGADLSTPLGDIQQEARRRFPDAGSIQVVLDVRYRGQSHETSIPYETGEGWSEVATGFHEAHRRRNGFARPDDPIELVTVRAEAVGVPALAWDQVSFAPDGGDADRGSRAVSTGDGDVEATVWWRPSLEPGAEVRGPAVIEEREATTWLGVGERLVVHESGALELSW
ncbi:MAG TPA: hydantoinase/oxoprolinase family protein [Acidimicrobiia bacterium]|nr:hydantoinase/oxoprolinase family protein [Acidimicrobiia bacterium]